MDNQTIVLDEGLQKIVADAVAGMKHSSDTTAKLGETLDARLDKITKMWDATPAAHETAKEVAKPEIASMKESLTSSFKDATKEIVPVAVGGGVAIFLTEVIDGVMIGKSNLWKGGAKAVTAVIVWKYGDKIPFMGKTGKNICAALIAFDAIRTAIPAFPAAISSASNAVTKRVAIGGLGDQRPGASVIQQANQIVRQSSAQRMSGR